jgi:hypothetical protein
MVDNPELLEQLKREIWMNCVQCNVLGESFKGMANYIEKIVLPELKMQADIEEGLKKEK